MLKTLHTYLGRELLKTFFLTSIALTLLVVMGGGVANLFRGEGVGATEMIKIIFFLTPVAVTLILPVAALFSATITYGRFAADNEILACRAAGVNIHRLLLSAGFLGLVVTVFTFFAWNSLIPTLSRKLADISKRDLPSIVVGQFQKAKPLSFGKYRMMANRCKILSHEEIGDAAKEGHVYILLTGVSFLEVEDQEPTRFGTADATIIDFDRTGHTPRVTVDLQGVRSYDAARRQYWETKHQPLGPFDIPMPIKRKIKFEDLPTLLAFKADPVSIPEMQDRLHGMRREMVTYFLYDEVVHSLDQNLGGDGVFRLESDDLVYEIFAEQYAIDEKDGQPVLRGVRVLETSKQPNVPSRVLRSNRATVELRSGLDRDNPVIMIDLLDSVEIRREPAGPDDRTVRKARESLKPIHFLNQPKLAERASSIDPVALLDSSETFGLYPRQERLRKKLIRRLEEYRSEVQGEIHFRASYALSAIAIVLLGATLGVIVRGGQVLTAFGISFVPMLFVIVASIVGRNLADRPQYALASVCVMWGSTAFLYFAMVFIARKFLKR